MEKDSTLSVPAVNHQADEKTRPADSQLVTLADINAATETQLNALEWAFSRIDRLANRAPKVAQ